MRTDIGVTLSLNFKKAYNGLALSTSLLHLDPKQDRWNFTISSTPHSTPFQGTGAVVVSLQGVNKDYFYLSSGLLTFSLKDKDSTPPRLLTASVGHRSANWAEVGLQVDEPCLALLHLSLQHTRMLTVPQVQRTLDHSASYLQPTT